jgi:hypothetical protein
LAPLDVAEIFQPSLFLVPHAVDVAVGTWLFRIEPCRGLAVCAGLGAVTPVFAAHAFAVSQNSGSVLEPERWSAGDFERPQGELAKGEWTTEL